MMSCICNIPTILYLPLNQDTRIRLTANANDYYLPSDIYYCDECNGRFYLFYSYNQKNVAEWSVHIKRCQKTYSITEDEFKDHLFTKRIERKPLRKDQIRLYKLYKLNKFFSDLDSFKYLYRTMTNETRGTTIQHNIYNKFTLLLQTIRNKLFVNVSSNYELLITNNTYYINKFIRNIYHHKEELNKELNRNLNKDMKLIYEIILLLDKINYRKYGGEIYTFDESICCIINIINSDECYVNGHHIVNELCKLLKIRNR